MGGRWLLPEPFLGATCFAPGLRILVVTRNKLGSTTQRKRWDFYRGYVKFEKFCSALISLHLSRELQLEVSLGTS